MGIYDFINLQDKVALVTGGSKGLGKTFAKALAEAGAHIVIASRHQEELNSAQQDLQKLNKNTLTIEADISREEQVQMLVEQTVKEFGTIDILVNNAASGLHNVPIEQETLEAWSSVINTNINGTYMCSREVAKIMMKQNRGKIINMASISGYIVNKYVHGGSYNVSKAAVVMLTKACAIEWAPYNINVNAIAPGYYGTKPNLDMFEKDKELHKNVIDMIPLRRLGNIEELGGLVVCLASDISNYMTGTTIVIDGGYTLW
jgi:gluconate 5-dehydrogenase